MNILVSAFACQPQRGSEPGVGWEWPRALARISSHQVTVLTNATNRDSIESYHAANFVPRLSFRYVQLRNVFSGLGTIGHYLYYYIWQLYALLILIRTGEWRNFHVIHHLTYGGIRTGSLLCLLPRRFVFGPVGGGETAPFRMYAGLGALPITKELLRILSNLFSVINPILIIMQLRASNVFVRTLETQRLLVFSRSRAVLQNDVACHGPVARTAGRTKNGPFRLLFAGRLLYWKGVEYLLEALRILDQDGIYIEMELIGQGPEEDKLRNCAEGLRHVSVRWHGRKPQPELFDLYRKADAFVFPSLHDSGGTVVIEALSFGLPVICFRLGGPPLLVGNGGIIVDVDKADFKSASSRLADAIRQLRDDAGLRDRLSQAALARSASLTWQSTARAAYEQVVPL